MQLLDKEGKLNVDFEQPFIIGNNVDLTVRGQVIQEDYFFQKIRDFNKNLYSNQENEETGRILVLPKNLLEAQFKDEFDQINFTEEEELILFYLERDVQDFTIFNKSPKVSSSLKDPVNLLDFVKSQAPNSKLSTFTKESKPLPHQKNVFDQNAPNFSKLVSLNDNNNSDNVSLSCPYIMSYSFKIKPIDFKASINGVLSKPQTIIVLSQKNCPVESNTLSEKVKEFGLSLASVIAGNFIREFLFSFLNNKEMLDLIKFDSVPEDEDFNRIDLFFTTFNCQLYQPFSTDMASFQSNLQIKNWFFPGFEGQILESIGSNDLGLWLDEYQRQIFTGIPQSIIDFLMCRYSLVSPEYILLFLLGVKIILDFLKLVSLCVKTRDEVPSFKKKVKEKLVKISDFFDNQLLQICFLIYFYNLIALLSFIKLIKFSLFGWADFVNIMFRSFLIVYPIDKMIDEYNEYFEANVITKVVAYGESTETIVSNHSKESDKSSSDFESVLKENKRISKALSQINEEENSEDMSSEESKNEEKKKTNLFEKNKKSKEDNLLLPTSNADDQIIGIKRFKTDKSDIKKNDIKRSKTTKTFLLEKKETKKEMIKKKSQKSFHKKKEVTEKNNEKEEDITRENNNFDFMKTINSDDLDEKEIIKKKKSTISVNKDKMENNKSEKESILSKKDLSKSELKESSSNEQVRQEKDSLTEMMSSKSNSVVYQHLLSFKSKKIKKQRNLVNGKTNIIPYFFTSYFGITIIKISKYFLA